MNKLKKGIIISSIVVVIAVIGITSCKKFIW